MTEILHNFYLRALRIIWKRTRAYLLRAFASAGYDIYTRALPVPVRLKIIRHARNNYVGKYQSCMFHNVGLIVHAPVYIWGSGACLPHDGGGRQ